MNNAKRNTGRTTRMMQEAIKLAYQGKCVYVVVDSRNDICRLMTEETIGLGIRIETPEVLDASNFEALTLRGAWPNVVLLVDHYVLERRFFPIISMYERFDKVSE